MLSCSHPWMNIPSFLPLLCHPKKIQENLLSHFTTDVSWKYKSRRLLQDFKSVWISKAQIHECILFNQNFFLTTKSKPPNCFGRLGRSSVWKNICTNNFWATACGFKYAFHFLLCFDYLTLTNNLEIRPYWSGTSQGRRQKPISVSGTCNLACNEN